MVDLKHYDNKLFSKRISCNIKSLSGHNVQNSVALKGIGTFSAKVELVVSVEVAEEEFL